MKYHIHIYRVVKKWEIDIEAENLDEALEKAYSMNDELGEGMEPEMKYILMGFEDES